MSIAATTAIWQRADISGFDKLVLLNLGEHCNGHGAVCWQSIAVISVETGLCRRTVQRCLSRLEGCGLVDRETRPGRSTVYRLNLTCVTESPVTHRRSVTVTQGGVTESHPPASQSHPEPEVEPEVTRTLARKRAKPAPDAFVVTDEMRRWARELRDELAVHPTRSLKDETDAFLDYHRSKETLFRDWNAAWRNWIRKALQISAEREAREPVR